MRLSGSARIGRAVEFQSCLRPLSRISLLGHDGGNEGTKGEGKKQKKTLFTTTNTPDSEFVV